MFSNIFKHFAQCRFVKPYYLVRYFTTQGNIAHNTPMRPSSNEATTEFQLQLQQKNGGCNSSPVAADDATRSLLVDAKFSSLSVSLMTISF